MTAVELVSNPELTLSTHSWTVQGMSRLTRENKLSSLPFWVPNNKTKAHQFQLVLLKGLAPAANAADDAYGLVMELVPPPTDPARDVSAASTLPGGCYVTARVLNHSNPTSGDVVASQTVLIDEANSQIAFPELLPAAAASSPAFSVGEPPAVTFVVTIRTGVNALAQQITNSVSSLWSVLTTSVSKLVNTGVQVYHEGRKEFEEVMRLPEQRPAAAATRAAAPAPWDVVPAKWSGRAEAWRDLVFEKAIHDDGLFLYGPERNITEDERQLLLQSAFNYRMLVDLYKQFDFDRDVHEGLLASTALRQQRYHLVPSRLREGLFWANYFWKVACLATCENDAQAHLLLVVLNAPPAAPPKTPDPVTKGMSDDEVMGCAADAQEAADLLLEYLSDGGNEDDVFLMETAANTCEDHVKRLDAFFRRTDLTESTVLVVGTTLRRLRERIMRYREVVRQREEAKAAGAVAAGTAPAASPPAAPTGEAAPSEAPPRTPTEAPAEAPPASPEPAAPPATSAATARGPSGSGPMVDFPKMPWEEDEEDGV